MASSSVIGPVTGCWSANIAVRSVWAVAARSASVNGTGLMAQPDSQTTATAAASNAGRGARPRSVLFFKSRGLLEKWANERAKAKVMSGAPR